MFSNRKKMDPFWERALSHANANELAWPGCRNPVGDGANRPATDREPFIFAGPELGWVRARPLKWLS
jgi:hypothetical protein